MHMDWRVEHPPGFPVPRARVWLPWAPGPEDPADAPVHVSLTDFRPLRARDLPGIWRAGLRLRQGWYGLPGAVGLCLWTDLPGKRLGSVSVWTNLADLRRWVALPLHRRIMRTYRDRGTLRSATWALESFDPPVVVREARRRLDLSGAFPD
jgi:hypothetical protein